jgi:hypothetical protein
VADPAKSPASRRLGARLMLGIGSGEGGELVQLLTSVGVGGNGRGSKSTPPAGSGSRSGGAPVRSRAAAASWGEAQARARPQVRGSGAAFIGRGQEPSALTPPGGGAGLAVASPGRWASAGPVGPERSGCGRVGIG